MVSSIASGHLLSESELSNHIKIYAGPGAGKTHFLVENVKNIVSTNELITSSSNRKVLCITYTNKAVDEIVRRLQEYNDYVECYTIHGFIIENIIKPFQSDLIRLMKEDFNINVSKGKPITSQVEGLGLLHGIDKESIYNYINLEKKTSYTYTYSKVKISGVQVDTGKFINSLGTNEDVEASLTSPSQLSNDDIVPLKKFIWDKARKLTHDEILYFGYRIIKTNPIALYLLRVKFPFIFVDEFQDTNPIQTEIIKLIGIKSTKVIIVGDVAQSIYSFQGAKISDFIEFNLNDEIKEFSIDGNRRSTETIVKFCNFIRQSERYIYQSSIREYSNDNKDAIDNISVKFLLGNSNEINKVIGSILSKNGVILTRSWADAFKFIQNIDNDQAKILKNIYYSYYNTPIEIRDEIREHNNVSWVRAFKFLFDLWEGYTNRSFGDIISTIQKFFKFDLYKIKAKHVFVIKDLVNKLFLNIEPETLTVEAINKFNSSILDNSKSDLRDLLEIKDLAIPIFSEYDSDKLKQNVNLLKWDISYKLFNEVFCEDSKYMTAHQSKGLEWEKVIVSLEPNKFDKEDGFDLKKIFTFSSLVKETKSDEFTRLFYVACSRAMNELYIHLEDESIFPIIKNSLDKFCDEKCIDINYEVINKENFRNYI